MRRAMAPTTEPRAANLARRVATVVLISAALVVATLTVVTGPLISSANAQGDQADLVATYIERTAELLQQAWGIVSESDSQRARRVLREAGLLHERSLRQFDEGHLRLAGALSRRARAAGGHAVRLARESLGYEDRARMRLHRFRDAYDQIRVRAVDQNSDRALRFLNEAEKQALRAREQYIQNNFDMALGLIDSADALLNRAARILFQQGGRERLLRDLERTAELIDRAEQRLGPNAASAAREHLETARIAVARAYRHLDEGQAVPALQQARLARRLARQATGDGGDAPTRESVQAQIERWDQRQSDIAEAVHASRSPQASRIYEQSVQHRARAGELLAADDRELALRQIKVALDMLHEAGELAR